MQQKENTIPTKNPRINVVLEKGLYNTINEMAANEGFANPGKSSSVLYSPNFFQIHLKTQSSNNLSLKE
jgi:hypothetical protein